MGLEIVTGFPDGSVVEESAGQCRRWGLEPWFGKIPWRRKWQPTPAFLRGESHGQRSVAGYSPWGCTALDTPEHANLAHSASCVILEKHLFQAQFFLSALGYLETSSP